MEIGGRPYRYNMPWCTKVDDMVEPYECIQIVETVATKEDIIYWLGNDCFGETVFLTKEDAERALKKRKR